MSFTLWEILWDGELLLIFTSCINKPNNLKIYGSIPCAASSYALRALDQTQSPDLLKYPLSIVHNTKEKTLKNIFINCTEEILQRQTQIQNSTFILILGDNNLWRVVYDLFERHHVVGTTWGQGHIQEIRSIMGNFLFFLS